MIDEWLQKTFGDLYPNSSGTDVAVDCPFCCERTGREDTKHHLFVSVVKPVAKCHRCDWDGSHIDLVMKVDGCTYIEALVHLQSLVPNISKYNKVFGNAVLENKRPTVSEPPGYRSFNDCVGYGGIEADVILNYLQKRGVPKDIILSSCGIVPGSNRAWILIDKLWWQGRSIFNTSTQKYISPPWPRGDSLWNASALIHYNDVTICEGAISAIHAGRNAVALCGKNMTDLQAIRLAKSHVDTYNIMLDSDAASQLYIVAARLRYHGYGGDIILCHLQEGDPADHVPMAREHYDFGSVVRHRLMQTSYMRSAECM